MWDIVWVLLLEHKSESVRHHLFLLEPAVQCGNDSAETAVIKEGIRQDVIFWGLPLSVSGKAFTQSLDNATLYAFRVNVHSQLLLEET